MVIRSCTGVSQRVTVAVFPPCRPLRKADGFLSLLLLVLPNQHLFVSVRCLFQPASCSRLFLPRYQKQRIRFPSFSEDCADFGSAAPEQSSVASTEQYQECCSWFINMGHGLWIKGFSSGRRAFHKRESHCSNLKFNKAEYPILVLQRKSNQEEMQACLK